LLVVIVASDEDKARRAGDFFTRGRKKLCKSRTALLQDADRKNGIEGPEDVHLRSACLPRCVALTGGKNYIGVRAIDQTISSKGHPALNSKEVDASVQTQPSPSQKRLVSELPAAGRESAGTR